MNCLICTPTRRLIQVIAQVNIQLLACTYVPRALVRPCDIRASPLQVVAAPCKRAVRVLGLGKGDGEGHVVDDTLGGHVGIEEFDGGAGCRYELHELAGDDLELAGGGVVAEEGGASGVERVGLDVLVEVGSGDGADPVVARLEGCAGSGSAWHAAGGWFAWS